MLLIVAVLRNFFWKRGVNLRTLSSSILSPTLSQHEDEGVPSTSLFSVGLLIMVVKTCSWSIKTSSDPTMLMMVRSLSILCDPNVAGRASHISCVPHLPSCFFSALKFQANANAQIKVYGIPLLLHQAEHCFLIVSDSFYRCLVTLPKVSRLHISFCFCTCSSLLCSIASGARFRQIHMNMYVNEYL